MDALIVNNLDQYFQDICNFTIEYRIKIIFHK